MLKTKSVACRTCSQPGDGVYCPNCGEKRLGIEDRSLRHILGHAVESATNLNGKAMLTVRTLLRCPGQLTLDYVRGRRAPYIQPLQFFLLANLTFFILHPLIGSN